MPEPTTSSTFGVIAAMGFSLVGALAASHPTALWGAMIGSIVCIMTYSDEKPFTKIFYFLISWAVGYLFAVEFIGQGLFVTEGAIACLCATFALPALFGGLYVIKNGKILKDAIKTVASVLSRLNISFKNKGDDDDYR